MPIESFGKFLLITLIGLALVCGVTVWTRIITPPHFWAFLTQGDSAPCNGTNCTKTSVDDPNNTEPSEPLDPPIPINETPQQQKVVNGSSSSHGEETSLNRTTIGIPENFSRPRNASHNKAQNIDTTPKKNISGSLGLMSRVQLCTSNCTVQCPDGSPPVYYFRQGDPSRLVIWLQGGGFCGLYNYSECFWGPCTGIRWSTRWTQPQYNVNDHHQGRVLLRSGGPLADWTMVFAIYCDGASFLGNASGLQHVSGSNQTVHLQGSGILSAMVHDILQRLKTGALQEVILGGTSAGGLATVHHCNEIGDVLKTVVPSLQRYSCVVEAGIFLNSPFQTANHTMRSCFCNLFSQHHATIPSCQHVKEDCVMAGDALRQLKYPVFVFQNVYDTWQTRVWGMKGVCARLKEFRNHVLTNLGIVQPPNGLFSMGCWSHSTLQTAYKAVSKHFDHWYFKNKTVHVLAPPFPKDRNCAVKKAKPHSPC